MGPVIVIKYSLILTEVIDFSYAQNFLYHVVKCEIREAKWECVLKSEFFFL